MIVSGNKDHGARIARASGGASGGLFNPWSDPVLANVSQDGELLGGIVYQAYTGASIQMHIAGFSKHWITRDFLWLAFDYPFNQLGCKVVLGLIPESNQASLEISRKVGFKIVAKVEDVFPDGACIITSLAREDCRWLNLKPRHVKRA